VDPQDSRTVYVTGSGGIFKSTDGGESWISLNSGFRAFICPGCYEAYYVGLLAIDPQNSQNLYATSRTCGAVTCVDGVLRSLDSGMSWGTANTGLPWPVNIRSLAIDPNHAGTVYAGTNDGVYAITFLP
jgi:hypothetical protein